jgi:hypothetical protein
LRPAKRRSDQSEKPSHLVLAQFAEIASDLSLGTIVAIVEQIAGVGHHYGHHKVLQRVAVDDDLRNEWRTQVDVLDLLGADILALRELEQVLLPVDYLQRAVLHNALLV